jgi:CPA2 family monovalent cation:H+ antiporter-2
VEEGSFLQDLVITLTAALLVLLPSRRLRIPAAVGFMLTGILIGPGGFGLIQDSRHVQVLAEIGVSILLFMIGLEFSTARLREIGRAFFLGGSLQVLGTIAGGTALVLAFSPGAGLGTAVFVGMILALSSTAMVLRIFVERGEHHAPQGRLVLGMLLFQDFAMVPMLLLVPSLAGTGTLSMGPRLLIGAASALAVWLAARYLMPRVVGAVIRSGVRELYAMMAVAVCLGASLATHSLGLSPALGAFLAGLLVSESEYSHHIVAEVLPFRDLFSSLFFIAIGMLLLPEIVFENLPAIAAILVAVLLVKAAVAAGAVRLMGYPSRIAVVVGISLAQVGEFSFVLATVGVTQGLLTQTAAQIFLTVAVVTLMLTPFLIQLAGWAGSRTAARPALPGGATALAGHDSGAAIPVATPDDAGLSGHVVVAGYGLNGRNVARVLRELGIPYVVLEVDPAIVRRARREGERIEFGDASQLESLRNCGVPRAAVIVVAISDPAATRFTVMQARRSNPGAYVIARTRQVKEVAELMRLGADEVIPEEFETSIAILGRLLRRFHVPVNVIRLQEQALRREGYSFLRGGDITESLTSSISELIEGATTDTFYLEPGSPAVGQTLAQLDLGGATRALIIAVVRDGAHTLSPDSGFQLQAGDILVLVGDHQALEHAFERLSPPRPA